MEVVKAYTDIERKQLYKDGLINEALYQPAIEKFLNCSIKPTTNKYNIFDYKSKNIYIELKSRKCSITQYPDIMIGANKIIKGKQYIEEKQKDIYYFFAYPCGLYYYKLGVDDQFRQFILNKYNCKIHHNNKLHYFIPTNKLIKVV